MGLKELAISQALRVSGEPEVIWKAQKEEKVSQKLLEKEYYFQLLLFSFSGGSMFNTVSLVLILLCFVTIVETIFILC